MDTLSSRRAVLTAGAALPALAGCASVPLMSSRTQIRPAAPFDMPAITIPDFSGARRFLITDFGAVAGDKDKTTAAIAQAIAAANTAGSGVVVIPAGEWLTGAIHFKSHVNLHVSKGATLLFSERPEDYLPPVQTSFAPLPQTLSRTPGTVGAVTVFQEVPSQRRMVLAAPTAQTLVLLVPQTP